MIPANPQLPIRAASPATPVDVAPTDEQRADIAHRVWLAVHCCCGIPHYTVRGQSMSGLPVHGPKTRLETLYDWPVGGLVDPEPLRGSIPACVPFGHGLGT